MKITGKILVAAAALLLTGVAFLSEEDGVRGRGKNRSAMRDKKGEMKGKRRGKVRAFMMENCKGAKEEMERHRKEIKTLREKRREVLKGVKDEFKEADEEKRAAVKEKIKDEIVGINKEIIEERAAHMEKMASLLRNSKDTLAEEMFEVGKELLQRRRGKKGGYGKHHGKGAPEEE